MKEFLTDFTVAVIKFLKEILTALFPVVVMNFWKKSKKLSFTVAFIDFVKEVLTDLFHGSSYNISEKCLNHFLSL
jgi:hypothetical protein